MDRKLIVDYLPFEVDRNRIDESIKENNGRLVVKGVLQRAESKNQNGRIYPKPVLERESKKYDDNFISENRALGELDHPDSSVVNLNNASHNITEMHWSDNDLVGTVEVLGTPSGNILKELFRAGIKLGISSRGLGSVKEMTEEDGDTLEVQPDFELIAFDFVSNPSTHGAFMYPMNESKQTQETTPVTRIEQIVNDIMRG
tara:strand:- start:1195 stop:1797 length:603 start_codon:yes stop_codon:yes gene_type:complete